MMTIWNTKILEQSQLSIPGSNFVWHFLFFFFFAFSREMFHCVKKKKMKSSHTCLPTEKSESGGAHTLITGKPKASCPSSSVFHNYRSLAIFGMCFQSLLLLTSLHCSCTALHCTALCCPSSTGPSQLPGQRLPIYQLWPLSGRFTEEA